MKAKIVSISTALSWFALVGGWYVFSALNFFHQSSILEPMSRANMIVSVCWLTIPPLFWWIPRKLLIRRGKWHHVGTIAFCIGNVSSFPCLLAFAHVETIYDTIIVNYSTAFLGMLSAGMLLMELLFFLFRKSAASSEGTA